MSVRPVLYKKKINIKPKWFATVHDEGIWLNCETGKKNQTNKPMNKFTYAEWNKKLIS